MKGVKEAGKVILLTEENVTHVTGWEGFLPP